MASLLQNLLLDLKRRGDWILSELAALAGKVPSDFDAPRRDAAKRVSPTVNLIEHRLRPVLEVPVLAIIHKYVADAIRKGRQKGSAQSVMEAIAKNSTLWTSLWHVEFACDMVATYWCGPAYGLANLRLSATRGNPYQHSMTHPADDARRAGIECILKLIGATEAAAEIERMWDDLKRLSPTAQPPGHTKRYSTRLLEQLAKCVYNACLGSGLRGFSGQQKREDAFVSRAVSDAWKAFQLDAGAFPTFESSAIERLKRQLIPA